MATNMPPHHLGETIDAVVAMIDNPDIDVEGLIKHVKGPDFPTGGTILGHEAIREAYRTGRGSITIRGKAEIVEERGKHKIVITEIPYQVYKSRIVEAISEAYSEKRITGIARMDDESNRKGMRVVIELQRNATPKIVLNQLFKHTPLQATFGFNMLALVPVGQTRANGSVALSPGESRVAFVAGFCSDRGLLVGEATVVSTAGGAAATSPAPDLDVGGLEWRDERSLWFAGQRGLASTCGTIDASRSRAYSSAAESASERGTTRCSISRIPERTPPAGRCTKATTRGGESSAPVAESARSISTPTFWGLETGTSMPWRAGRTTRSLAAGLGRASLGSSSSLDSSKCKIGVVMKVVTSAISTKQVTSNHRL